MKIVVFRALGLLLLGGAAVSSARAENFDFYVLALTWSPDYCATSGAVDAQQCGPGKRLGFVLHGLWPQYQRGYPADCTSEKLPAAVEARFRGLYPSDSLFEHEWQKHGTCSGLTPEQYLSLSQKLKESITIPVEFRAPARPIRMSAARFKHALVANNAALDESSLAVFCSGSGRFLKEVFFCFTREGEPIACSRELHSRAARSCRQADFLVRSVR